MDDVKTFCCQNPDCPDHGKRGLDNLRVCFRNGPHKERRVLPCRTWQQRFTTSAWLFPPQTREAQFEEK